MKIITLYNKIAKGEEPPKKIEFEGKTYVYEEGIPDYEHFIGNNEVELLGMKLGICKENFNLKIKVIKESNDENN